MWLPVRCGCYQWRELFFALTIFISLAKVCFVLHRKGEVNIMADKSSDPSATYISSDRAEIGSLVALATSLLPPGTWPAKVALSDRPTITVDGGRTIGD
jgi:hypothetical protein